MEIIQIIILGIIQGIAEFLPISSSAHLIIFRDVFGIGSFITGDVASTFDIALHLGTLIALIVVFFNDFWKMIKEGVTKGTKTASGRLFYYIIVATIPAGITGVLFEDIIDGVIHKAYIVIALALAIVGMIIYYSDKLMPQKKDLNKISLKDAFLIGCAQVFALIPGFSRSGTTIAAGRLLKLDRETATKFSFYMSAPVIAGACLLKLVKKETWTLIGANPTIFIFGVLSALIMGLICIKFLLKYIKKHDFKIFMIYRIALAVIVLLYLLIGV